MVNLPEPRTVSDAMRHVRIAERAKQIIAEGYSFWPDEDPTMDMVAVCKPGFLHADYWITEGGTVCDCLDFDKHKDVCKHVAAWAIVKRDNIPQLASTNLEVIRKHLQERESDAIASKLLAEMDELEDGRLFMENLHIERSLRR